MTVRNEDTLQKQLQVVEQQLAVGKAGNLRGTSELERQRKNLQKALRRRQRAAVRGGDAHPTTYAPAVQQVRVDLVFHETIDDQLQHQSELALRLRISYPGLVKQAGREEVVPLDQAELLAEMIFQQVRQARRELKLLEKEA